eukprot:3351391-Rhodomonas_salina.1
MARVRTAQDAHAIAPKLREPVLRQAEHTRAQYGGRDGTRLCAPRKMHTQVHRNCATEKRARAQDGERQSSIG